ncbi:MAG: peptidoglycan DD-metalloendopeptidase family protein [Dysgonamonadaceae bacterium]|jgi:septal ring factor EnvC (AmiA/AmiB activator)|nr:peptidoglycan DD-metalloendopeptidase family protein [Dysgonamonadaceae bacterium]
MKKLFLILISLSAVFVLSAQNRQIEDLRRQQRALQEEIQNTNRRFLEVRNQSASIATRIQLVTRQLNARRELIEAQNQEIAALEREERRLESEITRLDNELKQKQESYARAVRAMQNNNFSRNKIFFVLSGRTFGESMRRMQHLRDYSNWKKQQAEEIREQTTQIATRREELAKAKIERENVRSSLRDEHQKLQSEEKTHQTEMAAARGQERQLQRTLQDQQQRVNRLNSQIEQLIAEEVARQQREADARRQRDGSGNTAQNRADARADAEIIAMTGNFASNRGRMPMPVTGNATIVGNFGTRRHSEWANVQTNSNGIDIQTQQGANVRAVFDGEVTRIFSAPGSNNCVIVRHGEYFTFYSNIIELFVRQGDRVTAGQNLGRIFTDPDTGETTMHFQLWQRTTKLNPTGWLRR